MKIEIFRNKKGEHQVRLIARNGRKLMVSEGYKRRAGALRVVHVIRKAFEAESWDWK
jgi:uncharacterized protein YegP (UPF0339 family)